MSKKFERLKNAVFYAKESPELLTSMLVDNGVAFNIPDNINIVYNYCV